MQALVIPALYLPPISYFQLISNTDKPLSIEQFEHYPKQTYRARASIYAANGKLDLIVPTLAGNGDRSRMKDVKISYGEKWQRLHWLTLQTAYRNAAYFEYYEDDFAVFYHKQYDFLLDFNLQQLELLLKLLKIDKSFSLTDAYEKQAQTDIDYRDSFRPKNILELQQPQPYYQVFEDKFGFLDNLSIVDLLFNQGPNSRSFINF